MRRRTAILGARWRATLLGAALCAPTLHAQASLRVLDALPGADEATSGALGVSRDGQTIVGYACTPAGPGGREAALWTTTPFPTGLGGFPTANPWGHARELSADGRTIVGSAPRGNQLQAFRWSQAGGMQKLPALPGAEGGEAFGVSADGAVVVGRSVFRDPDGDPLLYDEATRWKDGAAHSLGFLPGGEWSAAHAVSGDGRVVVGVADKDGWTGEHVAFAWTPQTGMVDLGDVAGGLERGAATLVSHDGGVVAGWGVAGTNAIAWRVFRWTPQGGLVSLGKLPGHYHAQPGGMSADGSVIVGWSAPAGPERRPFVWDAQGGMRDLFVELENLGVDLTGWRDAQGRVWMEATGVSADGKTIVGHGRKDNARRGFVVSLP